MKTTELTEEIVEISSSCRFEKTKFMPEVSLEYIEHSTDHWHSDSTTSVDIDKPKAQEIVDFLCKYYNIKPK